MASLTLRGLTKRYPGRSAAPSEPALNDLDLDVVDGELLVLVGPSGCGKSTTLRLIAGLEEPSDGTVQLGDTPLHGVAPAERDVAMVFQGYALYPHLSVAGNIGFSLKMRGVKQAERSRRVKEAAERLGLAPLLDRLPQELSGGERQRVAMGRAIVRSPKVFLFDEPLSNLDAKLRTKLRVELAALVRRIGTTAIYVTHDQAEAMTMGDRMAVMDRGRLAQIDTPRIIYERPCNRFVAQFIGTPEINLLRVVKGKLFSAAVPVPSCVDTEQEVQVGVRPEHVLLGEAAATGVAKVAAVIVASEPHGAHSVLYLDVEGITIRARHAGFYDAGIGERIDVALDRNHLHWFDAISGQRIGDEG